MTVKQVTNSELQTFKDCRRRWWLAWYRGLRLRAERPVGAAKTGDRVHQALAPLYDPATRGLTDPLVIVRSQRAADEQANAGDPELLRRIGKEAELAEIMVEGYVEWLAETGEDSGLELIAAEEKLAELFMHQHNMPNEVHLAGWHAVELMGKVDARVRRLVDGVLMFIDHKTVGSLDVLGLELDEQMATYHLLMHLRWLRTHDPLDRPGGALYNMLRKVKRTPRATPPFYGRHLITHTDAELESMHAQLWGQVVDLARATAHLNAGANPRTVAYKRPSRDCSWKCEFLPVCHMFDDGSDAEGFLDSFYKTADPLDRYEGDED